MKFSNKKIILSIFIFAVIGLVLLVIVNAGTNSAFLVDPSKDASLAGVDVVDDESAANKSYVRFKEKTPPPKEAFSFAAAGDFGTSSNAKAVIEKIAADDTDFTLALGDLGYAGNGTERVWCDLVKSRLGSEYPFQLIAGNHDDRSSDDGDIMEYRKCLPNKIDNIVGDYAIEYYFDYNDLARFIMISPDIRNYGADYNEGDSHYNWVKTAVEDAKSKNIPWVVLGMHKNCITIGVKRCEVGTDIMNLALETGVDLILQGHEHGYYRSKQWKLGPDCPALVADRFDIDCVSNDGPNFPKDDGSVLVVSGLGGVSPRNVNTEDSEIEYFAAWSGNNVKRSYGYARFDVTEDALVNSFVQTKGDFRDTFTIQR